jgi:hypothetical protein
VSGMLKASDGGGKQDVWCSGVRILLGGVWCGYSC